MQQKPSPWWSCISEAWCDCRRPVRCDTGVVAYNRFADQVTRLEVRFDGFIEEFSTIVQRHAGRGPGAAAAAPER
jgi:hypothetical protein